MLTDQKVKALKPKAKQYKISDEKGMYLLIKTNGSKYWRLKYRLAGKEKNLAIGVYPTVSLKQARLARDESKKRTPYPSVNSSHRYRLTHPIT